MLHALLHLLYPHACELCGRDLSSSERLLCVRCSLRLPASGFHSIRGNPVEKALEGRVPLAFASAGFVFGRQSGLQSLIHLFKYGGRRDVAVHLGRQLGLQLREHPAGGAWSGLLPVPLHPARLRTRGYNQAEALAEGIASVPGLPKVVKGLVRKEAAGGSQTKRSRVDRWENVASGYSWKGALPAAGSHLLLIDDVLTTGATIEACGRAVLGASPQTKLSVCCLAWAGR
ncbi:ComF family protein [Chitinophaga sp.]|uniref:ComF family protein n=1 Tax=Chitinophaga sp. TaxID=1869181 RepID=UPI00261CBA6E|nr:ComF family protein [uncultured Chitinophaga sp.]